jgi:hypothetical protein
VAVRWNRDRQRLHQVRRDAQQRRPFVRRCPQTSNIRMLQIADTAVNHLETFGRRAAAEICALDEGCAQTTQGCVTRSCGAECPCAYDQYVVFALGKLSWISVHGGSQH